MQLPPVSGAPRSSASTMLASVFFLVLSPVVSAGVAGHHAVGHQHRAAVKSLRANVHALSLGTDNSSAPEVTAVPPTIVAHTTERRWWGFPNYIRELHFGRQSWVDFSRSHGHLGRQCMKTSDCGTTFVCNNGFCGECALSRDCGEHYRCEAPPISDPTPHRVCMPRDFIKHWSRWEAAATVIIVFTAVLSAAAGMGGGGVYVPVLLLMLGFSTKEAVPLSQAMIVGGAVVNIFMFAGDRHPKFQHRPKIDYDVIMMMNPGLAAGVTVGVICNVVSPQWLIVVILIVTLAISLQKSLTKGISQWQKESKLAEEARQAGGGQSGGGGGGAAGASLSKGPEIKLVDLQSFLQLARHNTKSMGLILGCWLAFLAVNLLKAPQCSTLYWLQLVGMFIICVGFTHAGATTIMEQAATGNTEGMLEWTPKTLWAYPCLAAAAGFLGGFLGIGGGIIMGPVLLELNMAPEASQATTAMFVFLSSSLATIQFIVLGRGMPLYAAWFTSWVVLATFVGQTLVDYILKKYQRSSLIVLSIAGIIAGSLIMMSAIGAFDVYTDLQRGAPMGFAPGALCQG
eukprot:TRINITY_DN111063_c0_g1_i1.p1 TRINITY_DN111063_c0_g1~~TRINITY_DN111063_c0_g1_i1.p1  ORF type:complete len:569 (+),score=145.39 TRINITY_DN111063_c0_g1_i1:45-1751(+)